jgi:hypothetical protein
MPVHLLRYTLTSLDYRHPWPGRLGSIYYRSVGPLAYADTLRT